MTYLLNACLFLSPMGEKPAYEEIKKTELKLRESPQFEARLAALGIKNAYCPISIEEGDENEIRVIIHPTLDEAGIIWNLDAETPKIENLVRVIWDLRRGKINPSQMPYATSPPFSLQPSDPNAEIGSIIQGQPYIIPRQTQLINSQNLAAQISQLRAEIAQLKEQSRSPCDTMNHAIEDLVERITSLEGSHFSSPRFDPGGQINTLQQEIFRLQNLLKNTPTPAEIQQLQKENEDQQQAYRELLLKLQQTHGAAVESAKKTADLEAALESLSGIQEELQALESIQNAYSNTYNKLCTALGKNPDILSPDEKLQLISSLPQLFEKQQNEFEKLRNQLSIVEKSIKDLFPVTEAENDSTFLELFEKAKTQLFDTLGQKNREIQELLKENEILIEKIQELETAQATGSQTPEELSLTSDDEGFPSLSSLAPEESLNKLPNLLLKKQKEMKILKKRIRDLQKFQRNLSSNFQKSLENEQRLESERHGLLAQLTNLTAQKHALEEEMNSRKIPHQVPAEATLNFPSFLENPNRHEGDAAEKYAALIEKIKELEEKLQEKIQKLNDLPEKSTNNQKTKLLQELQEILDQVAKLSEETLETPSNFLFSSEISANTLPDPSKQIDSMQEVIKSLKSALEKDSEELAFSKAENSNLILSLQAKTEYTEQLLEKNAKLLKQIQNLKNEQKSLNNQLKDLDILSNENLLLEEQNKALLARANSNEEKITVREPHLEEEIAALKNELKKKIEEIENLKKLKADLLEEADKANYDLHETLKGHQKKLDDLAKARDLFINSSKGFTQNASKLGYEFSEESTLSGALKMFLDYAQELFEQNQNELFQAQEQLFDAQQAHKFLSDHSLLGAEAAGFSFPKTSTLLEKMNTLVNYAGFLENQLVAKITDHEKDQEILRAQIEKNQQMEEDLIQQQLELEKNNEELSNLEQKYLDLERAQSELERELQNSKKISEEKYSLLVEQRDALQNRVIEAEKISPLLKTLATLLDMDLPSLQNVSLEDELNGMGVSDEDVIRHILTHVATLKQNQTNEKTHFEAVIASLENQLESSRKVNTVSQPILAPPSNEFIEAAISELESRYQTIFDIHTKKTQDKIKELETELTATIENLNLSFEKNTDLTQQNAKVQEIVESLHREIQRREEQDLLSEQERADLSAKVTFLEQAKKASNNDLEKLKFSLAQLKKDEGYWERECKNTNQKLRKTIQELQTLQHIIGEGDYASAIDPAEMISELISKNQTHERDLKIMEDTLTFIVDSFWNVPTHSKDELAIKNQMLGLVEAALKAQQASLPTRTFQQPAPSRSLLSPRLFQQQVN